MSTPAAAEPAPAGHEAPGVTTTRGAAGGMRALTLATLFAAASGYLVMLVAGRALGPVDYPLFATYTTHNLCQFWGPNTTKPGLENLQNAHLMLVQSEYDNATPIEGARNFFNQLPKSQWVYVPGEYSHAIFPYGDRCVDGKVVNYLLGIDSPERETVCPALPFAQDARTQVSRSGLASTYLNPAEAQAQIEALKDLIHNGTRR